MFGRLSRLRKLILNKSNLNYILRTFFWSAKYIGKTTVNPALATTSKQLPPVYNDKYNSSMASLNLTFNPLSENHLFQVPKVAIVNRFGCTFKTVYSSHPWDPQKVAVVYRWLLCRGFSIKMVSKLAWRDFFWPMLIDGRC